MVTSRGKSHSPAPPAQGRTYGSFWRLPFRITWPLRIESRSPGPATTRLMKFTSALRGVAFRHTWPIGGGSPHMSSSSAPVGGWKTTTSPTSGSEKRAPMRLTSTRWPICSVGTIDSLGIRYGLTRNAWIARASPRATATIMTSSSSEPEADEAPFFAATGLPGLLVPGGRGLGGRRRLGVRRLGLFERLLVDRVARDLGVGGRGGLGGRVVEQAALDDLLRTGVAALAHAGALADPAA